MTRELTGGRSDGTGDGRVLAVRRVRVLAAAVLLIDWIATGGVHSTSFRATAAVLGALVVIAGINALERRPPTEAWPYVSVVADLAWALAVTLVAEKVETAPWIVLAVPVLTAIVNFGLAAGLMAWGAASIGYLGGLFVLTPASDDLAALPAQLSLGVRQTALLLLVAIPAGYLTEQLAVEVHVQTRASRLARRRGGLLKLVAEQGTELASIDADVLALLCAGIAGLGFDAVDVVERTGPGWRYRATAGAPLPLPFAGDENAPECRARVGAASIEPRLPGAVGDPAGDLVLVALVGDDRPSLVVRARPIGGRAADRDGIDAMLLLVRQAHVAIRNGELVEELRVLRDDLRYEATHDALTGLANRAALTAALADLRGTPAWADGSVALLLLDLDGFKSVNDRRGHGIGDELLKVVTERLSAAVGSYAVVARLGGDEFTILLRDEGAHRADDVAERVIAVVGEPFRLGGEVERVGTSIGVARSEADLAPAELLRRADVAMYQAKQAGRRRFRHYSSEFDRGGLRRLELRMDLMSAVEEGRIDLHYQPIRRTGDGRVVGVEALLRWEHPVHGLVPPQEVVELAGVMQQSAALTTAVVERAVVEMGELVGPAGPLDFVAVNVATDDITAGWLARCVASAMDIGQIPPTALVLELSEALADGEEVDRALRELRSSGARVVIDDWGRRATTLAHIQRPVDGLKIHRSLLRELGDDAGLELLGSVVSAARRRGLSVVAEGVETLDDERRAVQLGCDLVQGYHVGPPVPAAEFGRWAREEIS